MAKRTWHIVSIIGRGYIEQVSDAYYIVTRNLGSAKRYKSQRDAQFAAQRVHVLDNEACAVAWRITMEEVGTFPPKQKRKKR